MWPWSWSSLYERRGVGNSAEGQREQWDSADCICMVICITSDTVIKWRKMSWGGCWLGSCYWGLVHWRVNFCNCIELADLPGWWVWQCMPAHGVHRLGGRGTKRLVVFNIFTVLIHLLSLSISALSAPPGRRVGRERLYHLWGIFSQEVDLAEPSKTDGIAVFSRSNSECLTWRPYSPSSSALHVGTSGRSYLPACSPKHTHC
jgi:hypothetical protein